MEKKKEGRLWDWKIDSEEIFLFLARRKERIKREKARKNKNKKDEIGIGGGCGWRWGGMKRRNTLFDWRRWERREILNMKYVKDCFIYSAVVHCAKWGNIIIIIDVEVIFFIFLTIELVENSLNEQPNWKRVAGVVEEKEKSYENEQLLNFHFEFFFKRGKTFFYDENPLSYLRENTNTRGVYNDKGKFSPFLLFFLIINFSFLLCKNKITSNEGRWEKGRQRKWKYIFLLLLLLFLI